MQFFLYFMPHFAQAICTCVGSYMKSTFGSLLQTKGVYYAKNSRSGVIGTPR